MGIQAQVVAAEKPFVAAERILRETTAELASERLAAMDPSQAEAYASVQGREITRQLLQGYLDLRSEADRSLGVVGSDGVVRPHQRIRGVPLSTVVGPVRVERATYGGREVSSLAPLDGRLNLPGAGEHSAGVRKLVCEEVARGSYDEACMALKRHNGVTVAKRQAENIARSAAVDFEAFYQERQRKPRAAPGVDDIIVLSTDGKGVVMLPEGLRPETQAKAAASAPKLRHRVSPGEKRNRKRMALVAAVYSLAPFPRCPEDIVGSEREDGLQQPQRPRPHDKRVWAGIEKSATEIIGDVFAEALRRDPNRERTWAVLVDGNVSQIEAMMMHADANGVQPIIIVDIIHVVEYLWAAAWCFFTAGQSQAEAWVSQRLLEILRGRCVHVAAGIRRSATNQELTEPQRKAADACCDYLLNNKAFLRYDAYLAAGLPIGTGVIEGACRYLVKDRMDITGARWGLPGAEAVLRLRALRASGDFDAYWAFHQARELSRNHLARYADAQLPEQVKSAQRRPVRHLRAVNSSSS